MKQSTIDTIVDKLINPPPSDDELIHFHYTGEAISYMHHVEHTGTHVKLIHTSTGDILHVYPHKPIRIFNLKIPQLPGDTYIIRKLINFFKIMQKICN